MMSINKFLVLILNHFMLDHFELISVSLSFRYLYVHLKCYISRIRYIPYTVYTSIHARTYINICVMHDYDISNFPCKRRWSILNNPAISRVRDARWKSLFPNRTEITPTGKWTASVNDFLRKLLPISVPTTESDNSIFASGRCYGWASINFGLISCRNERNPLLRRAKTANLEFNLRIASWFRHCRRELARRDGSR